MRFRQNLLVFWGVIVKNGRFISTNYTAPIVQWIGLRFPVPSIGVRLPVGVWGRLADCRELFWALEINQIKAFRLFGFGRVRKYTPVASLRKAAFPKQSAIGRGLPTFACEGGKGGDG